MRILELTFVPPDNCSGGGLGVYQSILSLIKNAQVDYVGPEFDRLLFPDMGDALKIISVLQPRKCFLLQRLYRMVFEKISTAFCDDWKETVKYIDWEKYDAVHIETSRYYFAIKEAAKNKKKTIVRMHNIESDYGYNLFKASKSISSLFRWLSFKMNEKAVLKDCDALVFITENDLKRAAKLYEIKGKVSLINPVCLSANTRVEALCEKKNRKSILLTGSLDFDPNVKGIIWFLDNVWAKLESRREYEEVYVTVAGRAPSLEIIKCISKFERVLLIDTPVDISLYFKDADIYIAPIFDGAGMKVKVAEALSYGLPVIGTAHAFIGYEKTTKGLYTANTEEDFINTIVELIEKEVSLGERQQIYHEFVENLSMESSCNKYKQLLQNL